MIKGLSEPPRNDGIEVIELCTGRIRDGRSFYAFVQMDIEAYGRYQKTLSQNEPLNLNAFGKILRTGWGEAPDAATARMFRETYADNLKTIKNYNREIKHEAEERSCPKS
jgi:hypothetical protein